MAPHVPDEDGWTVVGRVKLTKTLEKVDKHAFTHKLVDLEQDTALRLSGWGGVTDFYGQRKLSGGKRRSKNKGRKESVEGKDEVSRLVEKVESARLAVEESEFFQRFVEVWKAKNLSGTLVQTTDSTPVKNQPPIIDLPHPHPPAVSSNTAQEPSQVASSCDDKKEETPISSVPATSQRLGLLNQDSLPPDQDSSQALVIGALSEGWGEGQELEIVVYGVGSISGSETSRCQLAFALLLKKLLQGAERILVYDPAFSEVDKQAIERLGCDIISVNEEGRRCVKRPTLFYMPHCEEWMYDNVLAANWGVQRLSRVAILGNSFRNYYDRFGLCSAEKRAQMRHIQHVASVLEEVRIHDHDFHNPSAFNDMSWHTFKASSRPDLFQTL